MFRLLEGSSGAAAAAALAVLLLTACTTGPLPRPQFAPGPIRTADVATAVSAFQDICLDTAPDLAEGRGRFTRNGFVNSTGGGVVFDSTGTLSVRIGQVRDERGAWMRCSLVYQDPNRFIARESVDAMLSSRIGTVGPMRQSGFSDQEGPGERSGRSWIFRTGGRVGELYDVPSAGRGSVGVLVVQFPVR